MLDKTRDEYILTQQKCYEQFIADVLDTIKEMRLAGDFDENTLETLEWKLSLPTCECGGAGVKLDDVMAGETECEGCNTWVCEKCGQDV